MCPAGRYRNAAETPLGMSCTGCADGKYQSNLGSSDCTPAPPGTRADQNRTIDCHPGSFASGTGNTNCSICPPGTSAPSRSESCVDTPLGHMVKTDQSGYEACLGGTYADHHNAVTCQVCPPGSYSNPGSSQCSLCQPGSFNNASGRSLCVTCPAGSFSTDAGATNCTACPSGNVCDSCLPGHFVAAHTNRCEMCPMGSYCRGDSAESCRKCIDCTWNQYTPGPGAKAPALCLRPDAGFGVLFITQCWGACSLVVLILLAVVVGLYTTQPWVAPLEQCILCRRQTNELVHASHKQKDSEQKSSAIIEQCDSGVEIDLGDDWLRLQSDISDSAPDDSTASAQSEQASERDQLQMHLVRMGLTDHTDISTTLSDDNAIKLTKSDGDSACYHCCTTSARETPMVDTEMVAENAPQSLSRAFDNSTGSASSLCSAVLNEVDPVMLQ